MAQYRKDVFNLAPGPGQAIDDPRVAEEMARRASERADRELSMRAQEQAVNQMLAFRQLALQEGLGAANNAQRIQNAYDGESARRDLAVAMQKAESDARMKWGQGSIARNAQTSFGLGDGWGFGSGAGQGESFNGGRPQGPVVFHAQAPTPNAGETAAPLPSLQEEWAKADALKQAMDLQLREAALKESESGWQRDVAQGGLLDQQRRTEADIKEGEARTLIANATLDMEREDRRILAEERERAQKLMEQQAKAKASADADAWLQQNWDSFMSGQLGPEQILAATQIQDPMMAQALYEKLNIPEMRDQVRNNATSFFRPEEDAFMRLRREGTWNPVKWATAIGSEDINAVFQLWNMLGLPEIYTDERNVAEMGASFNNLLRVLREKGAGRSAGDLPDRPGTLTPYDEIVRASLRAGAPSKDFRRVSPGWNIHSGLPVPQGTSGIPMTTMESIYHALSDFLFKSPTSQEAPTSTPPRGAGRYPRLHPGR